MAKSHIKQRTITKYLKTQKGVKMGGGAGILTINN